MMNIEKLARDNPDDPWLQECLQRQQRTRREEKERRNVGGISQAERDKPRYLSQELPDKRKAEKAKQRENIGRVVAAVIFGSVMSWLGVSPIITLLCIIIVLLLMLLEKK